jgi:hypothetical protein
MLRSFLFFMITIMTRMFPRTVKTKTTAYKVSRITVEAKGSATRLVFGWPELLLDIFTSVKFFRRCKAQFLRLLLNRVFGSFFVQGILYLSSSFRQFLLSSLKRFLFSSPCCVYCLNRLLFRLNLSLNSWIRSWLLNDLVKLFCLLACSNPVTLLPTCNWN